ncbi:hypothetical protein [Gracilibacillus suaedae]|uniref:hypothetical protein n=1 Tax=Gracilibacillus suaedae TaxID=2820273 RepID=UPI001ABDAC56|nr:hypothetical protein [Gracilibacillus suaedae]
MYKLTNQVFTALVNDKGLVDSLSVNQDKSHMNWVINQSYLKEHNYPDYQKLFGNFSIEINNQTFDNQGIEPRVDVTKQQLKVDFDFLEAGFTIEYIYTATDNSYFDWHIQVINHNEKELVIDHFKVWCALSYIMFRDTDVHRNMQQSCAIFPHISNDYTRLIAKKRDNNGPDLAILNLEGKTINIGTFCRYTNRFREQVSPSLDGALFHQLILAESSETKEQGDWIYDSLGQSIIVPAANKQSWLYRFAAFDHAEEYQQTLLDCDRPLIQYPPVVLKDRHFIGEVVLPSNTTIHQLVLKLYDKTIDITNYLKKLSENKYQIQYLMQDLGEHKLEVILDNEKIDFVVFNVMNPIHRLIEARANYLERNAFIEEETDENAFGFKPISNQGESLGKLCFLLQKNLIAEVKPKQIEKVEKSAVFYIKNKWFKNGDLTSPLKIHGDFYRTLDFDYIAHVFFLLSKVNPTFLKIHQPNVYLEWAAEVMILRFDKNLHQSEREKNETEMNGVFNLFIKDLLAELAKQKKVKYWNRLQELWQSFCLRLVNNVGSYQSAITEHHFDNAGFGPTSESLAIYGEIEAAEKYGELILANIGISNDFRNQNPDRWWEALSYMIHSLWGGLVSHSALVLFEKSKKTAYLHAAYRSMMAVLYCYDWNASATLNELKEGEAASTYSVAYPNINKPSLSHNRFGQSVFLEDDPELFAGNATGDDWDMGEELVAYLKGFGTTTYVYQENGTVHCVNGIIIEKNGQLIIESHAAYPKEYKFYRMGIADVYKQDNQDFSRIVIEREHDQGWKIINL